MTTRRRTAIAVNDWVRSYSPGIWNVFRMVEGFHELRYRITDQKRMSRRIIVLSKRLVDEGWKRAFKAEACDSAYVQSLSTSDLERLKEYLASDNCIAAEFETFEPSELNFVMELRFNIVPPTDNESSRILVSRTFVDIEVDGITNTGILERIANSSLGALQSDGISNVTLRFLCRNHELREGEFVFRVVDFLSF